MSIIMLSIKCYDTTTIITLILYMNVSIMSSYHIPRSKVLDTGTFTKY